MIDATAQQANVIGEMIFDAHAQFVHALAALTHELFGAAEDIARCRESEA